MIGEGDFIAQDVGEGGVAVFAFEGGSAEEHFVDEDAKGPPVDGAGVAAAFDDFWSYVFLRSNERVRPEIRDAGFGVDGW